MRPGSLAGLRAWTLAALGTCGLLALPPGMAQTPTQTERAARQQALDVAAQLTVVATGLLTLQYRYAEAEATYRRGLAMRQQLVGPQHPLVAESLVGLARAVARQGRLVEAEGLYRQSLAITLAQRTVRSENRSVELDDARSESATLGELASLLIQLGRPEEAADMARRGVQVLDDWLAENTKSREAMREGLRTSPVGPLAAVTQSMLTMLETEATLWPDHQSTALQTLATALDRQGQFSTAESLHRRSVELQRSSSGERHPDTTVPTMALVHNLVAQGRLDDAESLAKQALEVNLAANGESHPQTLEARWVLGLVWRARGRWDDAARELRRVHAGRAERFGATAPNTLRALVPLAQVELRRGAVAAALPLLRQGCAALGTAGAGAGQRAELNSRSAAAECQAALAEALHSGPAGAADALGEAFVAAQRAALSAAGDALARRSARAIAVAGGEARAAMAFEDALDARAAADEALARSYRGAQTPEAAKARQSLNAVREQAEAARNAAAARLRDAVPRYWDLRLPEPVELAALREGGNGRPPLLGDDEALVFWLQGDGARPGLVFAVSRADVAWAPIGLAGDEIDRRVRTLRQQIDPCAYGSAPSACKGPDSGLQRQFDATLAWELHQALLGDTKVQRVLGAAGIRQLLVVPTGSLVSLPPALLLTRQPKPGEPVETLAWLLRDKALSTLPTVGALRTVREVLPAAEPPRPDAPPLFMFADPDFSGRGASPAPAATTRAVPAAAARYFRDGAAQGAALATLPRLPGTAVEARRLRELLGADPRDLALGRDARESVLAARRDALGRARVVAFATHGLVAGDLGSAEPALALAAPTAAEAAERRDDGLLTTSEIAQLRLQADWVLLSACNTAAPDAQSAPGMSGLSRAFFHAGARSLLVSHWRVDDDATQALVARLFSAPRTTASGKSQALRDASLAVMRGDDIDPQGKDAAELNDLRRRRAHPSAWAAFTLVGESR
jgi:CHAT domain-containing protein